MKKNKIEVIKGKATLITRQTLNIKGLEQEDFIVVDKVIIATGSESNALPSAPAKASIYDERVGKVKVIVEPQSDKIIGLSIVGPRATELIGQGAIMIHAELTTDMLQDFISAHPTLSEAVQEALFATKGQAVYA